MALEIPPHEGEVASVGAKEHVEGIAEERNDANQPLKRHIASHTRQKQRRHVKTACLVRADSRKGERRPRPQHLGSAEGARRRRTVDWFPVRKRRYLAGLQSDPTVQWPRAARRNHTSRAHGPLTQKRASARKKAATCKIHRHPAREANGVRDTEYKGDKVQKAYRPELSFLVELN